MMSIDLQKYRCVLSNIQLFIKELKLKTVEYRFEREIRTYYPGACMMCDTGVKEFNLTFNDGSMLSYFFIYNYNEIILYLKNWIGLPGSSVYKFEEILEQNKDAMCKDCVFKYQYQISRQCDKYYKKSTLLDKPEE